MVYIVEIPHTMPVKVWYSNDKAGLLNTLREVHQEHDVWDKSTVKEMLEIEGIGSIEEAEEQEWLYCHLVAQYGLDTPLYHSYEGSGEDRWSDEVLDELETYIEYNGSDLSAQHVYWSDDEAKQAVRDEITGYGGVAATQALGDLLAKLDVEIDDVHIDAKQLNADVTINNDCFNFPYSTSDMLDLEDDGSPLFVDAESYVRSQMEGFGAWWHSQTIKRIADKLEIQLDGRTKESV